MTTRRWRNQEFDVGEAMLKYGYINPNRHKVKIKVIDPNAPITLNDVERATKVAARLVKLYGETYLPLYKRMKEELAQKQQEDDLMQEAIQLANQDKG